MYVCIYIYVYMHHSFSLSHSLSTHTNTHTHTWMDRSIFRLQYWSSSLPCSAKRVFIITSRSSTGVTPSGVMDMLCIRKVEKGK